MKSHVAVVKCKKYEPTLVQGAVSRAIDLLGGITQFVKPQTKVLVKPNLLVAKEPEYGVDTHPEVVRAVIKVLKEINCKIILGDSPNVWGGQVENVDEVYERSGIKMVCAEEGVELVKFEKRRMREKFPLTTYLDEVDCFVSVPKFKTHEFTLLTAAIKNLFGLVTGTFKTELHKQYFERENFAKILVDIYEEAKPNITIIDGIMAMEGDGPGTAGKLRSTGLVFAGADCVALDTVLSLIMGVEPLEVLTTKEAAKRGLGVADINSITVLGEKLEDVIGEPFLLPSASMPRRIPRPIIELAKKFIRYYPCVEHDHCIRCAACIKDCPTKAISMKNNRIVFDYSKCIACFCCQEACPSSAIKVKKSIVAKLIGL